MENHWVVILDINTPNERTYFVRDTPFNVVQPWAQEQQQDKTKHPRIITLNNADDTIKIVPSYNAMQYCIS